MTLRFDADGDMAALVRRGGDDQRAMSPPPHVDWTFRPSRADQGLNCITSAIIGWSPVVDTG